jgi:hypothetical protein
MVTFPFECRSCGWQPGLLLADLGLRSAPNYLEVEGWREQEAKFPLRLAVCQSCWLVQVLDWLPPARVFKSSAGGTQEDAARYVARFSLDRNSLVIQIASNDGGFLTEFKKAGVPCLGIEPSRNLAQVAERRGIETVADFFGKNLGQRLHSEGKRADLVLSGDALAGTSQPNDFVAGLRELTKPGGRIVLELPYAVDLIESGRLDAICNEEVAYFSLTALEPLFARHKLCVYDAAISPIDGSLRLTACHQGAFPTEESVSDLLSEERRRGADSKSFYDRFMCQLAA